MSTAVFLGACSGIEADALYARRLPGPPEEADWRDAVPLRLLASGGFVHREQGSIADRKVDRDTVHRNSASCHHGPSLKAAFPVWLRAYYDDRNLYVRISWPDLTNDTGKMEWVRRDGDWRIEGGGGDGVAFLFPLDRKSPFNCSLTCHLDGWTVDGGRFQESARMRFGQKSREAILWMWRAAEGKTLEFCLDETGMRPAGGGEAVRRANSLLEPSDNGGLVGTHRTFGPGDGPATDGDGKPLPADFRPPEGFRLPAYLTAALAGESDMRSQAVYHTGLWRVTITRPLAPGDPRGLGFTPGGAYAFGLSVMDDTLRDHHIVEAAWSLHLLS